jgi:hypothetical protein
VSGPFKHRRREAQALSSEHLGRGGGPFPRPRRSRLAGEQRVEQVRLRHGRCFLALQPFCSCVVVQAFETLSLSSLFGGDRPLVPPVRS